VKQKPVEDGRSYMERFKVKEGQKVKELMALDGGSRCLAGAQKWYKERCGRNVKRKGGEEQRVKGRGRKWSNAL